MEIKKKTVDGPLGNRFTRRAEEGPVMKTEEM